MTSPVVVAVGAVIRRGDELLLVQRGHDPEVGRWSVPGGRVEPGESLRDAVQREVLEEVGLPCDVGELVGVVERRSDSFHFAIVDFACAVPSSREPVAGDDAAAVAWVPMAELGEWELVAGLGEFLAGHGLR
ncbi:MAG: NUDIX domain-containing protein [Actinomycetota bacterium]